jgi:CheY-like chemotaxis protein
MVDLEVLIIDDDEIIQTLHHILIKKTELHMSPQKHLDGISALNEIQANDNEGKRYLVLLDINMPVMGGWEFMDRLNRWNYKSAIDVVIVSSSIDRFDLEKAKEYPQILSYISKPITIENLNEIKSKLMNKPFEG